MTHPCSQPCAVYSRVVGYFRPVSNWNIGKQEEFKDRLEYSETKLRSWTASTWLFGLVPKDSKMHDMQEMHDISISISHGKPVGGIVHLLHLLHPKIKSPREIILEAFEKSKEASGEASFFEVSKEAQRDIHEGNAEEIISLLY